jgi:hypothetical protein
LPAYHCNQQRLSGAIVVGTMARLQTSLVVLVILVATCSAQQPSPSAASEQSSPGTPIPTQLVKPLDARKLKPGDMISTATTIALRVGGLFIPSGSIIEGHVISAQARSKGDSESSLALAFDRIELSSEKNLPIRGVVQAVGANPRPEPNTGAAGSGTIAKDTGYDQGNTVPGPTATVGGVNPVPSEGSRLSPNGRGVLGIPNLELTDDSVLVTKGKDLKLDRGTQLMIRVQLLPKDSS